MRKATKTWGMRAARTKLNFKRLAVLSAAAAAGLGGGSGARAVELANGDSLVIQGTVNNNGLAGQYYNLQQLAVAGAEPAISATATASPNFTAGGFPILQSALNQVTPATLGAPNAGATVAYSNVNFNNANFGTNPPFASVGYGTGDNITARWSGYINLPAGVTTFATNSDDGSVLYIDGARVVNNNQFQGNTRRIGQTANFAEAGLHEIVIAFYEGGSGAGIEARYAPGVATTDVNNSAFQIIPVTDAANNNQQVLTGVQTSVLTPAAPNDAIAVAAAATAALNLRYTLQASFASLSLNGGSTLNYQGAASRFGSTTLAGTNTINVGTGSAFSQDIALGQVSDGGAAATLNKTGPGQLVFDQTANPNALGSGTTINMQGGTIVLAGQNGQNNPIGAAAINLGAPVPNPPPPGTTVLPSSLTLTAKTAGAVTFDTAITVSANASIIAQQLAVPGNATLLQGSSVGVPTPPASVNNQTVTLGSATNGITVASGATLTYQTNNGYVLALAGSTGGAGNVLFNPGTFTIAAPVAPGGTLTAAGTSTFNLNVANAVNKNLTVPGNTSFVNYNVNNAAGGNTIGLTGTGSVLTIANAVTSIGTDSFTLGPSGIISIPNATVGGQLTRGTNLTVGANTVIAEQTAGASAAVNNLGTNRDLLFGLAGNVTDSVTVGAVSGATPFRGISTDRTARTLTGGTITALSDFTIQNVNNVGLTFQNGVNILTPNGPVVGSIQMGTGRLTLDQAFPASVGNVTLTINSGILQINPANALGPNADPARNVAVVAYPGTEFDPGSGQTSVSGNVTMLNGSLLTINDDQNLRGVGNLRTEPGTRVNLAGNATTLNNSSPTNSLNNAAPGTMFLVNFDNIAGLAANTNNAGNYQVQGANRAATITLSAATPPRRGFVSGLLTNDNAARTLTGAVTIGAGGGTLAAATGGTFTVNAPITVSPGGGRSLTVGTTLVVDPATNADIRSATVLLGGANNWGTGADALSQLTLVGRAALQGTPTGNGNLPQGPGLAVSNGGVYRVDGRNVGGTDTIDLGAVTGQGGIFLLNRNAGATPTGIVLNLNGPLGRGGDAFAAGGRGTITFQTVNPDPIGTAAQQVRFADSANAPADVVVTPVGGGTATLDMSPPWIVANRQHAPGGTAVAPVTTFVNYDATNGFVPVTYTATALPASPGTGTEIVDVTAAATVTGVVTVGAVRTSANIAPAASGTNALRITSGGLLLNGSAAALTISVPLDFTGVEGVISNISGQANNITGLITAPNGLTKFGGNSLALSNANNNVSGGITIAEANLRPGVANGLGTNGVVNILAAGVLDLNNFDQSIRGLIGSGVVNNQTGSARTLTINTVNADDLFEFTGTIRNAAQPVALTKTGSGSQILSGTLGYTGNTTVSAGRLVVNGLSTAASNYSIASAATLAGSGIITGNVTVAGGGNLAPGTTPGVLRTGSLTLSSAANYLAELNGPTPGTGYDQTDVIGTVTLTGSNLVATLNYVPSAGDKLFIINNDNVDAVNGTFANLPEGSTLNLVSTADNQPYPFTVTYTAEFFGNAGPGIGNDVALIAQVPEPAALGLLGLGTLGLLARRRRAAR